LELTPYATCLVAAERICSDSGDVAAIIMSYVVNVAKPDVIHAVLWLICCMHHRRRVDADGALAL